MSWAIRARPWESNGRAVRTMSSEVRYSSILVTEAAAWTRTAFA